MKYLINEWLNLNKGTKIKGVYILHFGDKVYIGASKNVFIRVRGHRAKLRNNKHRYSDIIGKYVEKTVLVEVFLVENILEVEKKLIVKYAKLGIAINKRVTKNRFRKVIELDGHLEIPLKLLAALAGITLNEYINMVLYKHSKNTKK